MTGDHLTVLTAVEPGKLLTKRIRLVESEWHVEPYDRATWFAVRQVQVHDLVSLGQALAELERQPRSCVIRGQPLADINWGRTRRLIYPQVDEDGTEHPATFEPCLRRWIALDFDDLSVPGWSPEDLARRRQAILQDYAERNQPDGCPEHLKPWPLWRIDDEHEHDRDLAEGIAGDANPAPIDPVHDSELVCRAAVATLPPEFHAASTWWQMTSSAGIKPGIRLRLWYRLDRPVSDDEAKRWLEASPVDRSLYSPVQAHYVAAPIFDPTDLDPVPRRCGFWWRLVNAVAVPELPEPASPETVDVDALVSGRWQHPEPADGFLRRRAERYAEQALRAVANAITGDRHPTLMAVAVRLFSLSDAGLLDPADVTRRLLAAAELPLSSAERRQRCTRHGGRASANEDAIDWARAKARAAPDLPEGFRP